MFGRREAIEIIDKFVELTQHGKIQWAESIPRSYMISQDSKVDIVYITNHLGRNISVYKRDYKYYLDDVQYTWDKEVVIEFINESGERIGQFPTTPNAFELLHAIQYQNPQIKNFYTDMFGE